MRRQFNTFLNAGRARRASQRDGVRRDAVFLRESRQPLLRKAPAAVERAVYTDEVRFWRRWFAGEPLHALARGQGDVLCLDAQRGGYSCCGQGCQQMHGVPGLRLRSLPLQLAQRRAIIQIACRNGPSYALIERWSCALPET